MEHPIDKPPYWHELAPHMGRRCFNWDYRGRGVYLITVEAGERGTRVFGRVEAVSARERADAAPVTPAPATPAPAAPAPGVCAAPLAARFVPNALGRLVERAWLELATAWPGVELLAHQVMEDHFHGVIAIAGHMSKPLGAIIGSFKARASSAAGRPLWTPGYVDLILGDEGAVVKAVDYVHDNPYRLAVKRVHREWFHVVREFAIPGIGAFNAIGNAFLVKSPRIVQLQCSRADFAYARDAAGAILHDAPPRVRTAAYDERLARMLDELAHGAVAVSPCISEGERALSRAAFEAGGRVIVLRNMGFAPLFKPGGRLFEACAAGRLLMLAPAAWPYQPAAKPITRSSACTLNRIAQLIAGSGAAAINYRGYRVADVDRLVAEATISPTKH